MLRSNGGKSTVRKPLADISNGGKTLRRSKKKIPGYGDCGALDRLLLVRSDLSNLVSQIDELVAQALEHKTISSTGSRDIESFTSVLCDMHSSLKPWLSRLRHTFGDTSATLENQICQPVETNSVSCADGEKNVVLNNNNESGLESILSPSPLVSWRAGTYAVESGRQLFLLTPLPKRGILPSKCPGLSKSMMGTLADKNPYDSLKPHPSSTYPRKPHDGLLETVEPKLALSAVPQPSTAEGKNSKSESSFISPSEQSNPMSLKRSACLLRSCLKASPPKSSLLPISEYIPEPQINESVSDDFTSGEVSGSLASRYEQLFGLQPTYNFTSRRKEFDESLNWFLSPPKSCVLMEPSDEKPQPTPSIGGVMLATPMWKDAESTVQKGKQPGENTLKKELWTKFEAASTNELHFDVSVFQKPGRKGFLDMLEEVSCEATDSDCNVTR